jgi:tetratricopeptide (TPR) repeat protein
MVFDVAYTFEKRGQFKKAIEYYLEVENRTDKVRFRISACFKALEDYQQAIKWLLEMSRTDANLLEVVDCYKLDGRMKEAIYWLFEILEPFNENAAELTALQLIEEYNYSNKNSDYPNFARRLSDVYLVKATKAYKSNFVLATRDYKKAVELIANDMGESPAKVSFSILDRSQNDYRAALEILDRQREAAERNFEDKVRRARDDIDTAEDRLRRARRDADRDYENRLNSARYTLKRTQDKLAEVKASANATPEDINRAERRVQAAQRDLKYIRDNRQQIIRDYLRPYQRDVREAKDAYDNLLARRTQIIEQYIAPYKRKVADAKDSFERIRALHEANFNY